MWALRPVSRDHPGVRREARTTREFIATHAKRLNRKGTELKTNVTDPDSAKMATGKGVIQGYAAQAAVDAHAQIIVAAEVVGSGSEQAMLMPMVSPLKSVTYLRPISSANELADSFQILCWMYFAVPPMENLSVRFRA